MGRGANDEKLITAHHIVARRVFGGGRCTGGGGGRAARGRGCPLNSLDYMGVSRSWAPRIASLFGIITSSVPSARYLARSLFLSRARKILFFFATHRFSLSLHPRNEGPYGETLVLYTQHARAPRAVTRQLRQGYGVSLRHAPSL